MAKKTNKGAKSAAEQAAAQQAAPETKVEKQETATNPTSNSQVQVITLGELNQLAQQRALAGLDPNHTEDLIARLDDRFYKDKDAAKRYNIDPSTVEKINEITARGMIALLANEIELAQTPFAIKMRPYALESIREAAMDMGIVIDQNLLPAPAEDGTVTVPSTAIKPSEEAQKAIKEEQEAASKKTKLDPTQIENVDELKDSLLHILLKGNGTNRFYDKVITAINFYEAYNKIQAEKSNDKDAKLEELKKKSRADFLMEIANLLGKCTFTVNGMAKFMYENTEKSKSPVIAFCTFRDASLNEKTGATQIDDTLVADIVKVLVRWYANTLVSDTIESIRKMEKDLVELKKDEKKNKAGIESVNSNIDAANKKIEHINEVVSYVMLPGRDVVDSFSRNYNDNKAEGFKLSRMTGSKIAKTYYHGIDVKTVKPESLLHNLQQYVGVITNMFLPPLNKITDYSEANITELEIVEEEKKA